MLHFWQVENKSQNFMCWELDILRFLTGVVGIYRKRLLRSHTVQWMESVE